MNFFQQELRKIVDPRYPDATYIGRVCYVYLSARRRAKIQIVSWGKANVYNAIQLSILDCCDKKLDSMVLRFNDAIGYVRCSNPYVQRHGPYILVDDGRAAWSVYHPTQRDYQKLTEAVYAYIRVFQTEERDTDKEWTQSTLL